MAEIPGHKRHRFLFCVHRRRHPAVAPTMNTRSSGCVANGNSQGVEAEQFARFVVFVARSLNSSSRVSELAVFPRVDFVDGHGAISSRNEVSNTLCEVSMGTETGEAKCRCIVINSTGDDVDDLSIATTRQR